MYLFQVRNDLWRIFVIEKRNQLVEAVRLSTYIDNFDKKNIFKGVKFFLQFLMWNFLKNSFLRLEWTRNYFLVVFWPFLVKKSPSRDPIDLQKSSHVHDWNHLIKTLHLNTHMTIFGVVNFLTKKVAKLVETQKFCDQRLNRSILHTDSYYHFPIR